MHRELPLFVRVRRRILDGILGRRHRNLLVFPDVAIVSPYSLRLGDNVSINRGCQLSCAGGLVIGDNVSIGHGTSILTTEHGFSGREMPIRDQPVDYRLTRIGNDVLIGCRVVILAGVEIADGTFVGAGSVVTKSITEPNTVVGGVPARRIKGRFDDEKRTRMRLLDR